MNLLIGLVIILCLACSELKTAEAATDLWTRLIAVGLVSMAVPGLALFQTLIVTRKFQDSNVGDSQRDSTIRRLSVCHTAVWLTASLAIIWGIRWQDVVRGNWNFDRFPLLDEAFILAPIILSLVASWAIFYEIQHSVDKTRTGWFKSGNFSNRLGYVSIRFRVYFLLALIPISIAVLARDFSPWINGLSPTGEIIFYAAAVAVISAGFPFMLLLILQNQRVEDAKLRTKLINTCKRHRLFVQDVRVWKTGNRIVNALVAGMIPGFRIILLSDSLINLFPKNELLAVVRHEAGHLRLWHLPTRVCFIVMPLIALMIDEHNPVGLINGLEEWLSQRGLPQGAGLGCIAIMYLVYLFLSLSWLSHKMEFEADIYSCQSRVVYQNQNGISADPVLAKDMSDALLRLASISPAQFERWTVFHPSIRQRIRLIQEIQSSSDKAELFHISFSRRRRIVLAILSSICLLALLA